MLERAAPRGDAVCGEVVCAGVERAMDVVVGEVDVGQSFVETFGDGREVDAAPFDRCLESEAV